MSQGDTSDLSLFERRTVRRVWHRNEWFYSVVLIVIGHESIGVI